jgi:hypothetical protein
MLKKSKEELAEKIVTGGGATGKAETVDPVGGKASLPGSKNQGDSMEKGQNPGNIPIEDTSTENNVKTVGNDAAKNKASVSMKESITSMFEGETLSEEFVLKATTIVESVIAIREQEIIEDAKSILDEEITNYKTELAEKVDSYLKSLSETWLIDNEVAIVSSLKTEITEDFINGMKNLFTEHYIDLPEDKVNVVESLSNEIDVLKSQLDEEISIRVERDTQISNFKKAELLSTMSEGLSLTQIEKLNTISEGLEYNNLDTLKAKLEVVKEEVLKETKKKTESNILTEEFESSEEETKVAMTPEMSRYASAISRTIKK